MLPYSSVQFSAFRLNETPTFRTFPYFPYSFVLCRSCVSPQRNDKKWKMQGNCLAHSSVLFRTLFGVSPKRNTYFPYFSVLFRTLPYFSVLCRFCVSPQRNDKKSKLMTNWLPYSSVLFRTLFSVSSRRNARSAPSPRLAFKIIKEAPGGV